MKNSEHDLMTNEAVSSIENALPRRTIKSFVRREGRLTEGQKRILLMSPYLLEPAQASSPWDLDQVFGRQNTKRTLEIGFGNGASLIEMAKAEPERDFIGVEVHRPGVGYLLLAIEQYALTNIYVINHDIVPLLTHYFQANSFDRVQIFFPDPWHKKRHHKRRLIQATLLAQLFPIMQEGGYLHCATDWQDYAEHILTTLMDSPWFNNQYETYSPRPEWRPLTKFEQRGQRLGHGVWDILFKRHLESNIVTN